MRHPEPHIFHLTPETLGDWCAQRKWPKFRAKQILDRQNAFIREATNDDPRSIAAGYDLNGAALPDSDYSSLAFIAPFGVGAMSDCVNQAWLNDLWDVVIAMGTSGAYYEDTLKLLSLITMSGNWWTPADAPCPND